jgi:cobalt/nickel transport system permease protein
MHIPDGYLSPATCATMGAAMVPVWTIASRRVKRVVTSRYVPLVALGAAYSFLVMMLNVPIPDGTSAHAVGAVLIAVLLGPWAAVIAVSVALLIQALFFGDGGVLAFGANAFNMAFVMPMVGYGVYRLVAQGAALTARRRAVAAGIGAFVGINAAAFLTAVEFGLQPELFTASDGTPLYAPFHLAQSIPAMMFAHLTVAGPVEFALTAGIVAYLQRANLGLLRINHPDIGAAGTAGGLRLRPVLVGLAGIVAVTPLGLLATGTAFGEDGPDELALSKYDLSAVPHGLQRYSDFWTHSVLGDYGFASGQHPVAGYLLSAVIGIGVIALVVTGILFAIRRLSASGAESVA